MIAKEPVMQGSVLLQVPLDALMTAGTARASDRCGSVAQSLTDWQALSLHLITELAAGEESQWSSYINLLPAQASCIAATLIFMLLPSLSLSPHAAKQKIVICKLLLRYTSLTLRKINWF